MSDILTNEERIELGLAPIQKKTVYVVVGETAAHDGGIGYMDPDDRWSNDNPGGWTYQDVCGAHGHVLLETEDKEEADRALAEWLQCPAAERGDYCYTHNPDGER